VLNYCMEALPPDKIPYDPYFSDLIDAFFVSGASDKAVEMAKELTDYYYERLDYYLKQNPYVISSAEYEIQSAIQYTSRVANFCLTNGKPEMAEEINKKLEAYYADFVVKQQSNLK